ncbi:MAG: glucose-1-phosphate thymidylyltransferase [Streptomyces sp.]
MKSLVLSGGTGTRLRPLSHSMPKQLVPVANKPVLFHALEALAASGVTETGIIINARNTSIPSAVGDGSRFGMAITYLPQESPQGLAHCVMIARDFLADDDFVMYLGDNIFSPGITEELAAFRRDRPTAQLLLSKVSNPSAYGIAELDGQNRVTALEEKPARPRSDLAVTGAFFFTPEIHEAVDNTKPSWRGELEITDAIQWLVSHDHEVRGTVYSGFWKDTGTLHDLLECNRVLLEALEPGIQGSVDALSRVYGPVVVEPGARVERSVLVGPTVIGAGSIVEDSYVGAFSSLGRGCRLQDAGVESSIILDHASVRGVRTLHDSIVGKGGDVRLGADSLSKHRLMVGDDCRVEIPA